MTSPKNRQQKSDMDIEKHREEGNWRRCLELAQQNGSVGGAEHANLQNFLTGEAKLEIFMEEISKKCLNNIKEISEIDKGGLEEAKTYLKRCLEGQTDSPLTMDANLLLAKAYYVSGDFHEALNYIRQSGIDTIVNIDKSLPLRVIKLIAESFSVKGMSLAKTSPRRKLKFIDHSFDLIDGYTNNTSNDISMPSRKDDSIEISHESYKAQIECLTKAANLAMRYVQNIEKLKGPYFLVNLGHILDSAIMKTHHVYINNGHLNEAIDYCRRMLNYCETSSTLNIRQILAKELSEILLKGVCRGTWKKPELSTTKSTSNPNSYQGNSLLIPNEYEEEIILLLMLSEVLVSRNVILERTLDFHEPRIHSLNNVLLVLDLYTITLIPLKIYFVENFERSMKFSYEVKHMWFQFALTMMESKKSSLRSLLLLKEVVRMDPVDPVPNLIAAKLCMTELGRHEEAIQLLNDAMDRYSKVAENKHRWYSHNQKTTMINNIREIYGEQQLLHQIHLMLGIAHALVYECDTEASKKFRSKSLANSLHHLNESIKYDINGNNYLPYYHIALHMAHQRALKEAIKYVRVSLMLNSTHLPSIQLLILCLTGLRQYQEAYDLCTLTLKEFPFHLILLYIKAHLEEIVCENGKELALLTGKQILKQWRYLNSEQSKKFNHRTSYCSFIPNINYDTMSLRMEQTLSEVISLESVPIHVAENASQSERRYISQASSVNDCGDNMTFTDEKHSWAFEMQIWLMIVDLFLKLDQITEAETCVNDGAVTVFGLLSHQLMYIKGVISKKRGQWYDAKVHFQNAISINPKHAKALQQLGHTYYLLGNQISADKYLKDSLNIDSTLHETWAYMGLVLDAIGEHERACECHLTSLRLEETNPLLSFSLVSRTILD
ncbi:Tetratricopeptide repeat protein 7B [Blomia tropicalis]|nr:Tetratricopeptide repeat protein 7B [Blomia tropicalis]